MKEDEKTENLREATNPRGTIHRIIPLAFAALVATSLLVVYQTQRLPLVRFETTTLYSIHHEAAYDYRARLKPNLIYNRTTLRPGEGPLYTAIVDHVNITLKYRFRSDPPPAGVAEELRASAELESPGMWTRPLTVEEAGDLLRLEADRGISLTIDASRIRPIVEGIDSEVGVRSQTYAVNILPEIRVDAVVAGRTVAEEYAPALTIAFVTGGERGNYISIGEMEQAEEEAVTVETPVRLEWVEGRRRDALAFCAVALIGLAASTANYVETRDRTPRGRSIRKIVAPHEEMIVRASEPPEAMREIALETLDDLARVAEITAKPILWAQGGGEHTFCVLDGETRYLHRITEAEPAEASRS